MNSDPREWDEEEARLRGGVAGYRGEGVPKDLHELVDPWIEIEWCQGLEEGKRARKEMPPLGRARAK